MYSLRRATSQPNTFRGPRNRSTTTLASSYFPLSACFRSCSIICLVQLRQGQSPVASHLYPVFGRRSYYRLRSEERRVGKECPV